MFAPDPWKVTYAKDVEAKPATDTLLLAFADRHDANRFAIGNLLNDGLSLELWECETEDYVGVPYLATSSGGIHDFWSSVTSDGWRPYHTMPTGIFRTANSATPRGTVGCKSLTPRRILAIYAHGAFRKKQVTGKIEDMFWITDGEE